MTNPQERMYRDWLTEHRDCLIQQAQDCRMAYHTVPLVTFATKLAECHERAADVYSQALKELDAEDSK